MHAVALEKEVPEVLSGSQPKALTVTLRAFVAGLLLSAGLAWLNCWLETLYNVHFLGGIQMPFGAVFALLILVLFVNVPLRAMHRFVPATQRIVAPLSSVELLTIYSMLIFAALISTPGCDNFFLTAGPTLFYFSKTENGWANIFYKYVPSWFAPGWDGHVFQKEVINPLYLGGLKLSQIPWHAWAEMLIAWSLFLLLCYSTLFFLSLMLRKQWIENEALAFPLVQLPLEMVEIDRGSTPASAAQFWTNRAMWFGFALALIIHFLRGMHNYFPDWPTVPLDMELEFSERPWNVIGKFHSPVWLGGIGIAYLLTREVSFSFWFFFLFGRLQLVLAEIFGFPAAGLPKDGYMGAPLFISFQSIGGWVGMAVLLLWAARGHLANLLRAAVKPDKSRDALHANEPFSPRFIVAGFVLSFLALLAWSWFAGINIGVALTFFGIYVMGSIVLARIVIEGGLLFPQLTFSPLEWMTTGLLGSSAIGAANLTKLSFLQPPLMSDARTNVLPGFLHTMKIAAELGLDRKNVRRLLGSTICAIFVALAVTIVTSLAAMYSQGGLSGYTWFTYTGPQSVFNSTASAIQTQPGLSFTNVLWTAVGVIVVVLLTFARSRFLWFPLHPLGYILAPGYPMTQLWFSFFLGWLLKTMVMKYGGSDSYAKLRPAMIGLILGNLSAMMLWMIIGFFTGQQIPFWPA